MESKIFSLCFLPVYPTSFTNLISFYRTNNLTASLQSQIQNLRENLSKISDERTTLKRDIETKNQELQEKMRTVTQVKKIGRRYKTQYDELKVEHDKVRALYPYGLHL